VHASTSSGRYSDVMIKDCKALGMKPVCDHPHYCKSDSQSLYLGQDHHIAYPGHRNNGGYFPKGWSAVSKWWDGLCSYTARAHGKYALCNIPTNTHSWQSPASAYKNFICGKYKEAPCTKLSTLAENNFNNRGDTTLNSGSTYTYKLSCGYTVKLSGWTHTRNYAKGFLRNQPGSGKAVVEGLKAGATYNYRIYQYASHYAGTNSYTVNGQSKGSTTSKASDSATASSTAVADSSGRITFVFNRQTHHVHLSGIAIAEQATAADGWIKGPNGKDCNSVCQSKGRACNSGRMSALQSNAKVGAAFRAAGYTCKGYHGPRSYAGTPFSTARGDDCAPVTAGKTVSCTGNAAGHHSALCCCVPSGAAAAQVCPILG